MPAATPSKRPGLTRTKFRTFRGFLGCLLRRRHVVTADRESKTRWSGLRDLFAATREAIIVIAVLLILRVPSFVRESL